MPNFQPAGKPSCIWDAATREWPRHPRATCVTLPGHTRGVAMMPQDLPCAGQVNDPGALPRGASAPRRTSPASIPPRGLRPRSFQRRGDRVRQTLHNLLLNATAIRPSRCTTRLSSSLHQAAHSQASSRATSRSPSQITRSRSACSARSRCASVSARASSSACFTRATPASNNVITIHHAQPSTRSQPPSTRAPQPPRATRRGDRPIAL